MRWLLLVFASACSFSARSAEQPTTDAASSSDGLSADCTPDATACDGRVRKVCGADGHWNPTLDTVCNFTCSAGACLVAGKVNADGIGADGGGMPAPGDLPFFAVHP